MLRPGYALFGGNPDPVEARIRCAPWCAWRRAIAQVRDVAADEGQLPAIIRPLDARPSPRRLATLSHGLCGRVSARRQRSAAMALVGGVRCPILGLISMDLIILDVTDAPGATSRRTSATLIGDSTSTWMRCRPRASGTIGYEILTSLGSRYVRRYVESTD